MNGSRVAVIIAVLLSTIASADRVAEVRQRRQQDVRALVEKAGLTYPVDEVYLRAFKQERQVELWAGKAGKPLVLIKTYAICAASGVLGPKRREGDLQVPEGLYEVPSFNPFSDYHLSMKVSYPNASDKVRSDPKKPGGLIYMHGNCASIGCIAIEDEPIEEVYLISLDATKRPIRMDIFPTRLTKEGLEGLPEDVQPLARELQPAYLGFEAKKRPSAFTVDAKTGAYRVR